jgi:diguanylate cyclase (GGDEF)-like protein/PAS domain S-box-containing protein
MKMSVDVPDLPGSLLELSMELLAVFADERFLQVNARWEQQLGWAEDELIGRRFSDFVHPDDLVPTEDIATGKPGGREVSGFANRWRHRDGSFRWLLWETRVLGDGRWLCAARDITGEREALAERQELVDELLALQRVAKAVAAGASPEEVCSAVSGEAGRLLRADAAGVAKVLPEGQVELVGGWIRHGAPPVRPGFRLDLRGRVDVDAMFAADRPVRVDASSAEGPITRSLGFGSSLTSPVVVDGRDWGFLMLVHAEEHGFAAGADARLAEFAQLTAMAIANAEARAELERRALTDSLTSLMNHQAFHDRLQGEVERAHRHGRELTVAVIDLDEFKAINDSLGHRAGDRALRDIAHTIRTNRRLGDLVGRVGGDELALILTDCSAADAHGMLERLRDQVAAIELSAGQRLTFSAGVCDLTVAQSAEELFRVADEALYRSKREGRGRTTACPPLP